MTDRRDGRQEEWQTGGMADRRDGRQEGRKTPPYVISYR
jgi:hypothetical protein